MTSSDWSVFPHDFYFFDAHVLIKVDAGRFVLSVVQDSTCLTSLKTMMMQREEHALTEACCCATVK